MKELLEMKKWNLLAYLYAGWNDLKIFFFLYDRPNYYCFHFYLSIFIVEGHMVIPDFQLPLYVIS